MPTLNGTVLLVSTDPSAPDGLKAVVRDTGVDIQAFDSIEKSFEQRDLDRAACLVLDMRRPDAEAKGSAEAFRSEVVSIPVICITGSSERGLLPAQADEFADTPAYTGLLDAVTRGLRAAGAALRTRSARSDIARRFRSLTPREHQVMGGVVQGLSNKLIANELGISARTIEIHRAHVMEKTGAAGLSDLVRMAFAVGAVGAPDCSEQPMQEF